MMYLLDVNALLALGVLEHTFHPRTARWINSLSADVLLATCAITELGFLRVLLQTSRTDSTLVNCQKQLRLLKASTQVHFRFLADDQDGQQMPKWVKWPKQVTDGHLVALANSHRGSLATLDQGIPGSFLIPR